MSAKRILVVDDNLEAARALAVVLELWGHQVFLAHDGRAALEQVRRLHPQWCCSTSGCRAWMASRSRLRCGASPGRGRASFPCPE